jgi:hypothetical protein
MMSSHRRIIMTMRAVVSTGLVGAVASAVASAVAVAQKAPSVRAIGPLERSSTEALASAATALPMPGGRVLVNDLTGRRLLLFDSTLARAIVVADTSSATSQEYDPRGSSLIRYRGDTALLVNPGSLSMLVIGPAGTVIRVMAIPRPNEAQALSGLNGAPGFDARGRLVYFNSLDVLPGVTMLLPGDQLGEDNEPIALRQARIAGFVGPSNLNIDTAFIIRVDLATRVVDTVASVKIPKAKRVLKADAQHLLTSIETTPDPLPVVDDWAVLADGSIAIVRGRDYHVDVLDTSGHWTSFPKMPFDWQRVSDERKQTLIDSAVTDWQATFDRVAKGRLGGVGGGGGGTGGRGGGGGPPTGAKRSVETAPNVAVRPAVGDLPEYMPPFEWSYVYPARADADGNLWIRTTTLVGGQPVYDIVNRRGERVDRVRLPSSRTIAGFGPGVIYMAVKDAAGAVHLERARIR